MTDRLSESGPKEAVEPFDRLLREHLAPVLRIANHLTGNPDQGEELAQEALLKAIAGRREFRGEARFSTWLYRIVLNTWRDRLKRRKAEPWEAADEPCTRTPGPVDQMIADELRAEVQRAIATLPERQRATLVLIVWEGLSPSEVAVILGTSANAVHTALSSARAKLKELLANHLRGDRL